MSISELKEQAASMSGVLDECVAPLNERLDQFGLVVYWIGTEFVINSTGGSNPNQFFINDYHIDYLMSLSDDQLHGYCLSKVKS